MISLSVPFADERYRKNPRAHAKVASSGSLCRPSEGLRGLFWKTKAKRHQSRGLQDTLGRRSSSKHSERQRQSQGLPSPTGAMGHRTFRHKVMNINHYTYRVTWSSEDNEHVGLCAEFPSLTWLASTQEKALEGIRRVVAEVVDNMQQSGEPIHDAWRCTSRI